MLLCVRVDVIKLLIGLGINETPQTPTKHVMRWIIKFFDLFESENRAGFLIVAYRSE